MLMLLPCLLMSLLWWMFAGPARGRLRRARPGPARDLPVHRDVPRDQRDHPARAGQRHPRAAAVDADGQARLPARLRPRLRAARRRAVGAGGRGERRPARPRRQRPGLAARRGGGRRRRARHGARPARQRLRATPSSRRCSSCRPSSSRRSCCAGCSSPRDFLPPVLAGDQRRAAAVLRRRRDAGAGRGAPTRRACGRTSAVVLGFALAGLALGAATLRRRTA